MAGQVTFNKNIPTNIYQYRIMNWERKNTMKARSIYLFIYLSAAADKKRYIK